MGPEKVREVICVYRKWFEKHGVRKVDYPHTAALTVPEARLEHCHGMLDKMEVFIEEMRMEKVFRWLGFLQGVLWHHGVYTLEDLKNHNRPDEFIKKDAISQTYRMTPDEIRAIRMSHELSQPEFAKRIRTPLSTLRKWEQGRSYPSAAAVALLRSMAK